MAAINLLISDQNVRRRVTANISLDVAMLDAGLFDAGKIATVIYDQSFYPKDGFDAQSVAALATALLLLLDQLGCRVDAIEEFVRTTAAEKARSAPSQAMTPAVGKPA